ncbi:hypothetical protein BpHYR1_010228 [Brachionus plicatilis]|uniref:Uncharacterized protein n=1 Tax=Brachionus plicatilis TaxID=10195 RepID=A0A3M7Q2K4_BRAPC|nr:hypothetical protein BpHYR1_010228 [Brachionus plicatilis]
MSIIKILTTFFLPDLASSHYSILSTTWMNENVNYVTKDINPPNVPQAPTIENFWDCLYKTEVDKPQLSNS